MESLLAEPKISKKTVWGVKVGNVKLFRNHWTKSDLKHLASSNS